MEIFLGLTLLTIIIFYLGFISGKNKTKKDSMEEFFKSSYKEEIHPLVKDIYVLYTSMNGINHIIQHSEYVFSIPILGVSIYQSKFFTELFKTRCNEALLYKQYHQTLEEIEKSLNFADRTILEKIIENIRKANKEFIDKIFIES